MSPINADEKNFQMNKILHNINAKQKIFQNRSSAVPSALNFNMNRQQNPLSLFHEYTKFLSKLFAQINWKNPVFRKNLLVQTNSK